MTHRFVGGVVLTGAMVTMAAGARAQGPVHSGIGGMMDGPMGAIAPMVHVLQQLDLTDSQKQQLHTLFMQAMASNDQAQIQTAEQQLHAAVLADVPDQQAIENIKATLNAAHAAELDQHIELMLKVAQILTPDQRQQLLKMHPQPSR